MVYDEIQKIFPSKDSPVVASDDLNKMDFSDRFIKETMRLYPVVPIVSRYAKDDVQLGFKLK